jgi:hypothetical protein
MIGIAIVHLPAGFVQLVPKHQLNPVVFVESFALNSLNIFSHIKGAIRLKSLFPRHDIPPFASLVHTGDKAPFPLQTLPLQPPGRIGHSAKQPLPAWNNAFPGTPSLWDKSHRTQQIAGLPPLFFENHTPDEGCVPIEPP